MPVIDHRNVLKGLRVQEAMRRQVIRLPWEAPLAQAIRYTIKYKVNAVLAVDDDQVGLGVVSKTDLMGAYYAHLLIDTPVAAVMAGPPLFCRPTDTLDAALDAMRRHRVHRLYVQGEGPHDIIGVLAYPDIVGLLYRYCTRCDRSLKGKARTAGPPLDRFLVREVMTPEVYALQENDTLQAIMEGLAAYRFGAVLITDRDGRPAGIVSKTDLITAYLHGLPTDTPARRVMTKPAIAVDGGAPLAEALTTMIFADLHRLFVYRDSPENLVGVLSLSDVARFRSGTCRACLVSRIRVGAA
ncbi:MAG: CBS domain-containing protein [Deltaproteobacteria bacterium]|nr:CBS domain-containing protein [Deltaproteobacteria bacterium]